MSVIRLVFGVLATLLVGLSNVSGESFQEEMDQASDQFNQTMGEIGNLIRDVTFDEEDIKSIIKHRSAVDAMDDSHDPEGDDYEEQDGAEDMVDFNEVINDPEYVSWAKSEGLEPGIWMKKFMRVQIMVMKDEMASHTVDADAEMKQQLAELESQREQMGEAMYQQMKQLLTMAARSMSSLEAAYRNMPEATAAESLLLKRYRDQLIDL